MHLAKARAFLATADRTMADSGDDFILRSVGVANAVLGAIAASDAICAARLGLRSRGQDHTQATALLEQVVPKGAELAKALVKVLDSKDAAHYQPRSLSRDTATMVMRQAHRLLDAAEDMVR